MYRLGKWLLMGLVFCISVFPARVARAGIGFQPVSQEELNLKNEPLAPGAPAIILYRQVDREDGRVSHEDQYVRIKILTEDGRKYGNVEIPYFKGIEDLQGVRARTIRPDGSIAEFAGQGFDKELVTRRGLKYLARVFALPDAEVGSIIEYSYTMELGENRIFESHWILSNELLTKKARFSLKAYREYSLRWAWHGLRSGAEPKEDKGVFRMEADNIPAFPLEDYMPPPDELKSRVDFIYERGLSEKDPDSFWRNFGRIRNAELETFIGKRKTMEEAVAQTVSSNDSQEVKLRKIYDRVQQIRNTSYELRKTAQEEKREKDKPAENVEDVWKRGGTGIQLTWLFLGLARAAGFEAYGCWVSSRRQYFFSPETMQSAKLNANVVLVKLNGKDLYLDPGGPFAPFGLLEWSETSVAGLRLDKDGGTWIKTTLPEASASRIERVGKLKLSDTGDLEGKLTVTYIGLEALYHRLEERHADEVARKRFLEGGVTSQIGMAAQAELTNRPDWTNSETPLVAEFDLKVPGWASNAGKRVILPAAIFTAGETAIFEHENRVHPIYFEYPYQKVDDLTVELPAGMQVSSLPMPQDIDGKAVLYSAKVEQSAGALRLTRKLTIDVFLLNQKYYPTLRNFFQAVRTSDGLQIVVQPGEIHANN